MPITMTTPIVTAGILPRRALSTAIPRSSLLIQICPCCRYTQRQTFSRNSLQQRRAFTNTPVQRAQHLPDHYATLSIPADASQADIKKSFYKLSKKYHPDLNHTDPNASKRFVEVSEAYHVLGSAEARRQYDAQYHAGRGGGYGHSRAGRTGSYSSASESGPAGARPASGLSRRRTQFRGPPPSFYRNGAWGAHGAKRSAYAEAGTTYSQGAQDRPPGANANPFTGETMGGGGFSAGQAEAEFDPDPNIAHWDRAGHARTHEGIRRRRQGGSGSGRDTYDEITAGGSVLFNFVIVSGLLSVVVGVPAYIIGQ